MTLTLSPPPKIVSAEGLDFIHQCNTYIFQIWRFYANLPEASLKLLILSVPTTQ